MRRRRSSLKTPEAHINITSLLDVVFVLLISFMVVAPALKFGIELELPKVGDSKEIEKKKPVNIQVKSESGDAHYFVNGKSVELAMLAPAVKGVDGYNLDPVVALEADRSVPWENMAQLINELKSNNIRNIGIVTEKGARR
ncbi:N/A [soil metagenome]